MHIYICIYIYTYICLYVCIYIYIYICIYLYIYVNIYVYVYVGGCHSEALWSRWCHKFEWYAWHSQELRPCQSALVYVCVYVYVIMCMGMRACNRL